MAIFWAAISIHANLHHWGLWFRLVEKYWSKI